jgi:hypothetical protein
LGGIVGPKQRGSIIGGREQREGNREQEEGKMDLKAGFGGLEEFGANFGRSLKIRGSFQASTGGIDPPEKGVKWAILGCFWRKK